jgi:hypothetical protein
VSEGGRAGHPQSINRRFKRRKRTYVKIRLQTRLYEEKEKEAMKEIEENMARKKL